MSISDAAVVIALLMSVLSAVYARWSWCEAKKANQIALRGDMKKIYDAFFHLRMHMMQKAEFADQGEVSKFYYTAQTVGCTLSDSISADIKKYFDACFWIAEIHKKYGGSSAESYRESEPYLDIERKMAPSIDEAIIRLLKKTR